MIERDLWNLWLTSNLRIYISGSEISVYDPNASVFDPRSLFKQLEVSSLDLDSKLFLITAWNPNGVLRPSYINKTKQAELLTRLASLRVECWPSLGSSESWQEWGTSFLSQDDSLAQELGNRFGQAAYYRVSRTSLSCVEVGGKGSSTEICRTLRRDLK